MCILSMINEPILDIFYGHFKMYIFVDMGMLKKSHVASFVSACNFQ